MMRRCLKLAKRLLNPKDGVLIVTIDEKEYLRLGLLLEELSFRRRGFRWSPALLIRPAHLGQANLRELMSTFFC
jgi:adenine-specific DNA-methyltransferase